MNTTEAQQILNRFGSTHEHQVGKYYADFNIKVYHPNIPNDLTDVEREYIERDLDPYETIRDNLVSAIADLPHNSNVEITGRSGGWIVVEWPYPTTIPQTIKIAKEIEKIKILVDEALHFVRSEEFWRNFVEGVDPKSSKNYNPKTKLVEHIVCLKDSKFGVCIAIIRGGKRRYYYHKKGELARLLAVLNSHAYYQHIGISEASKDLFIAFKKIEGRASDQ